MLTNFDINRRNCADLLKYYLALDMSLDDSVRREKIRMSTLIHIGHAHHFSEKYRKILENAHRAEKVALQLKDQSGEALCCTVLGIAYLSLGESKNAIDYFEKGLKIGNAIEDQSRIASNTGNLGNAYYRLGEYQKAISFYNMGIEISSAIGDQSGIAVEYGNLGNAYYMLGEYKKAINYYEKEREIGYATGDQLGIASSTGSLGYAYHSLGEYHKSIDFFQKSLEISNAIGDQWGIASNTGGLGNAYRSLGEYQKAIGCYLKGLQISRACGDQSIIAANIVNLGNAYLSLGEYQKAIDYCEEGLNICSAIGDQSGIAGNLGSLGNAYYEVGDYQKAIDNFEKALEISNSIGDQLRIANNNANLVNAYQRLGEYKKAMDYSKKGKEISSAIGHQYGIAILTANLGSTYLSIGENKKAIDCFEKCLQISIAIKNQSGIALANRNLGNSYLCLGECEKAIAFLMKGLEVSVRIGEVNSESLCRGSIGYLYFFEGQSKIEKPEAFSIFQKAVTYLKESVYCRDQIFLALDVDQNKISFTNEYFDRYVILMHCFINLQRIEAALLVIDLGKAKALLASMEKRKKAKSNANVDLTWGTIDNNKEKMQTNEIQEFLDLKSNNLSVLLYAFDKDKFLNIWFVNGEDDVKYFKKSEPLEESIFACLNTLCSHFGANLNRDSTFSKLDLESAAFGWQNVSDQSDRIEQAKAKFDEARKQAKGDDNFAKSKNTTSPKHQSGEISNNTSTAVDFPADILRKLFQVLIHPVKSLINGKKLIIVPHKFLFFVPFCSLLDENGCQVSHSYSIQITPSLHTLVSSMTRSPDLSLNYALFVGNPTVNVSFRGEFPKPLPSASEEVKYLAPLFEAAPLLEGKATKERVMEFIQGASIIHIAAHGEHQLGEILLAPNPDAKEEPKEDSYLLKEQDIVNFDINARLVVLSCCYTGRGKISSEGVVELTRAFLVAGARAVLATLWPINDQGTIEFMKIFYDEICKGTPVCEALRKTMNIFQRHRDEFCCSFNIWAPFTIYGEDVSFSRDDIEEIKRKSREMFF